MQVLRPTASLAAQYSTKEKPVYINASKKLIHCGRETTASPAQESAIRVTGTVTATAGGDGVIALVQRIRSKRHTYFLNTVNGVTKPQPPAFATNVFVLDRNHKGEEDAIIQFGGITQVIQSSLTQTVSMLDSLEIPFGNFDTHLNIHEEFELFLMYQPTGGIWVTLRKLEWNWKAVARRVTPASDWELITKEAPKEGNTYEFDSIQLPTWNRRVQDLWIEYQIAN